MKFVGKLKLWEICGLVEWSFLKVPRDFLKVFQNFENSDENCHKNKNGWLTVEK